LLPGREPATAQAWLSAQPQISIVARDCGGGYALAAAKALPKATHVADRWHLMENVSRAFLDALRKSMRHIRTEIGAATIKFDLLTAAERIQYEGYLRREDSNAAILGLARDGVTIKEIVRRTGYSRGLVRRVLRGQRSDIFRVRESSLELYLPWLDAQWASGQRNGAELWRKLKSQGFRGCASFSGPHHATELTSDSMNLERVATSQEENIPGEAAPSTSRKTFCFEVPIDYVQGVVEVEN
jgi:transposase